MRPTQLMRRAVRVGGIGFLLRRGRREFRRALDLRPRVRDRSVNIGRAYEQKGMHAQAQAAFQKILAFAPDDPAVLALIGHDYALSGQRAEAAQVITRLKNLSTRRYVPSLYVALIYTGLGDKNEAFRFMEAAFSKRRNIWFTSAPNRWQIRCGTIRDCQI